MTVELLHDFDKLIEAFCAFCKLRNMTDESIRRYQSSLTQFADYFPHANPIEVTLPMLEAFLRYLKFERNVKLKTIENNFSALSAFYEYLVFHEFMNRNPILSFRRMYLRMYKDNSQDPKRKLLSIEEMSQLVNSILDSRDRAIAVVLAKTGIRRGELLRIDVDDIDWSNYSITLKPAPKRSNRIVYFDEECAFVLRRWLTVREKLNPVSKALFISYQTLDQLKRNGASHAVIKYAKRLGFYNAASPRIEDHFGPHCFRHWFTTMLLRNGMPREYVKELRGDKRREAVDIYNHINKDDLRRTYLACIPKLGI